MTAQDESKAMVIMNVRIFDGKRIIPEDTVVFEKGKITAIGRNIKIPEGAEVLEAEDKPFCRALSMPMFMSGMSRI